MMRRLALLTVALTILSHSTMVVAAYTFKKVTRTGAVEYRLYLGKRHFMSVINQRGAIVIRPHPGVDPNGWGTSLYMQPFFPGAVLKRGVVKKIIIQRAGCEVISAGSVCRGASGRYGTWGTDMIFRYDAARKEISGAGTYNIRLSGRTSIRTGDLNLLRIASNYLDDVPLLNGRTGDTGDMKYARVVTGRTFTWVPEKQPAYFPCGARDIADRISITVSGAFNNVDTAAQGYRPIKPAYKPSLKVALVSKVRGIPMIFGGMYDVLKRKMFYEDNVGITPLVLRRTTATSFAFKVGFCSKAPAGDGSL